MICFFWIGWASAAWSHSGAAMGGAAMGGAAMGSVAMGDDGSAAWRGELLARHIQVYRDPSRQLGIVEIEALPPEQWQSAPTYLNFGFSSDTIWLRLDLRAPLPEEPHLWLQRSNMKHVCLFSPAVGGWRKHCEGASEPLAQSYFLSPDLVFPLQPGSSRHYLSINTANLVFLPLRLESARSFQQAIQRKQLIDMLILGALLATLLFNLLLFLRLQIPAYLYYVCFICTNAAFLFGFLFGYNRLLPQFWFDILFGLAYPLNIFTTLFLLESMLGFIPFKTEDQLAYRILRGAQILFLLLLLLTFSPNASLLITAV
ncbi:MAG: hypothetical protein CVV27_20045, partial [Candidatus Melainabacteria bacterium HGW-Melainabacteria-1]